MADTAHVDEIAGRARALIEEEMSARVDAVRVLVEASYDASEAEERARTTAAARQSAYRAAIEAGWTEAGLRKAGIRAPGAGTQKRRPARTTTAEGAAEQ